MTTYTFKAVHQGDTTDTQSITIKEFEADHIEEILENFREFLLGVGFSESTLKKYDIDGEDICIK